MRLRSRGLGRRELVMDFREYRAERVGDEMIITGSVHEPVNWDFSFRVCEDDIPGIVKMMFGRKMLGFGLRSLFRRHKDDHWTDGGEAHRAAVKVHMKELDEKVAKQALDLGDERSLKGGGRGSARPAAGGSDGVEDATPKQKRSSKAATAVLDTSTTGSEGVEKGVELADDQEAELQKKA